MSRYIDADKLVSELWRLSNFYETVDKSLFLDNELCGKVIDVIDRQENVEAEPIKHGHWILVEDFFDGFGTYQCTNCRTFDVFPIFGVDYTYEYCPHCGAKMDKEIKI